MIYQAKSTEFGGFYIKFFQNLKFGQILSGNSNFEQPKSTEIPEFCPFRSGPVKKSKPKSKSLERIEGGGGGNPAGVVALPAVARVWIKPKVGEENDSAKRWQSIINTTKRNG
jgi:hypothetical protein